MNESSQVCRRGTGGGEWGIKKNEAVGGGAGARARNGGLSSRAVLSCYYSIFWEERSSAETVSWSLHVLLSSVQFRSTGLAPSLVNVAVCVTVKSRAGHIPGMDIK